MSENESLELSWVTDAHTGAYTLTVNTGSNSLHKEFTIRVLTATTGSVTGELRRFPPPPLFLFVSHSISAFPQGWINNLAEGPERLTELNKLHWTRELILDFCYYSVAHSILILIS